MCDGVVEEPEVPDGGSAVCGRCGALLFRRRRRTVEITFALMVAAAILFAVANAYPFLAFEMQGQVTHTTLGSGVQALWEQGSRAVAGLVLFTTILSPASEILLLLYVLAPLHFGAPAPGAVVAMRWVSRLKPWSMMEVFLIGILVAVVKLADMAEIVPGVALWAFAVLIPILAGAAAFLDTELVWRRLGEPA
ncbi:MAG: paraquat-inducible protein A [Spirochaetaceae bacterium]|nr:paraquat-inducible protein A [Myxococcales bacterium]MCB9725012.1 paraquat-inducible protein A [Spirochaetaceae bacterium]